MACTGAWPEGRGWICCEASAKQPQPAEHILHTLTLSIASSPALPSRSRVVTSLECTAIGGGVGPPCRMTSPPPRLPLNILANGKKIKVMDGYIFQIVNS